MANGHGNKITRKQEAAIAALMNEPTIGQAAKACGISKHALLEWMKRPAFQLAFEEARKEIVETAQRRLTAATGAAITTLVRVTKNKSERACDRVRAAIAILGHSIGARMNIDGETKLTGKMTLTLEELGKIPLEERIRMLREGIAASAN